jgi:hypothetical protein
MADDEDYDDYDPSLFDLTDAEFRELCSRPDPAPPTVAKLAAQTRAAQTLWQLAISRRVRPGGRSDCRFAQARMGVPAVFPLYYQRTRRPGAED